MAQAPTQATLRGLIAGQLSVDENRITDDAHFINDLGADSLDCVELAMEIEDYFGIEILDEDAEPLRTLRGWVDYLGTRNILAPV